MSRTRRSEAAAQAEADLKYWGYNVGKQYAADGYPTATSGYANLALLALLSGHSDMNPLAENFGINVKDVPADAWRINAIVMRIRAELRIVLVARYCLPVDYETGQSVKPEVIAHALNLTVRTYFRRLRDAREKFARLKLGEINGINGINRLTEIAASA